MMTRDVTSALKPDDPLVATRCEEHRDVIARYARHFAKRGGYDPAGIASDAMLGLLQAAQVWNGNGEMLPLAYTIAKRRIIDGLRRRHDTPSSSVADLANPSQRGDYLALAEALRELPRPRAEVLLRRLRGHTNAEIGAAMGIAATTVSKIANASGRYSVTGSPLTDREVRVLELAAEGLDTFKIAAVLHIGRETVKTHQKTLRVKLDARTIGHAIAIGVRDGLIG